jgi:transposase
MVLGVGIDWAEAFHLVALGHPEEGVIQIRRVEHTPAAVDQLIAQIAALEPDPAEVRVVIETRHGLLVERLLDAGYVVLPVNPDLVARRRGPARKKDDAEDARIACLLALDRHTGLRPLVPHGEVATELRAIARDDERAARDQRRLLNRLRHDLLSTYPAALAIAGDDLGAPTVLKLLQRWPTRDLLAAVSRQELVAFARANRHGWPERLADKIIAALTADQFTPRAWLVRAKADTIRLAATHLLAIATQRRTGERRRASCWWAPLALGESTSPGRASRGRRSPAARSTSASQGSVTASPPGSRARSATIPNSSGRRTRWHVMPARPP